MSLYKSLQKVAKKHAEEDDRWVINESAVVVDNKDPEGRHRVKVAWSSIDEDISFEDWVTSATTSALGDGFGSHFVPEVGSEVFLTGVLGQKYNLIYYGSPYNEDVKAPDLGEDTQGIKVPKHLSIIAKLLFKLQSLENNVEILAAELARIQGKNTEVIATELAKMTGENVQAEATDTLQLSGDDAIQILGGAVTINSDDTITIHASTNVSITATGVLTLQGRVVNKTGPAI
jgi:hypothetical protein